MNELESLELEDLEAEVRRMLRRRAGDIEGDHSNPAMAFSDRRPDRNDRKDRKRPVQVAIGVAAAILVAGFITIGRSTVTRITTAADDVEVSSESAGSESSESGDDTAAPSTAREAADTAEPERIWTVESAMAAAMESLPPGFDPYLSPPVFIDRMTEDPDQTVANRLSAAVELISPEPTLLGAVDNVLVYQWTSRDGQGFVLVRTGGLWPEVVAIVSDGVAVDTAERTIENLTVAFDVGESLIPVLALATANGEVITTLDVPESQPYEVVVEIDPIPVAVRVGTTTTGVLTEFGVDAVGFGDVCGTEPPVSIDVGTMAEPVSPGPVIEQAAQPLINQQVWNHQARLVDIEIRWPPDPRVVALFDIEDDDGTSWTMYHHPPGQSGPGDPGRHTLLKIDRPDGDPCALIQISVDGDDAVADWWAGAFSSQWQFGEPLSIAQLDPDTLNVDPSGQPNDESGGDLVAAGAELPELPVIPDTGTCDLLPEAPPQSGPGTDEPQADAEQALAAFVANGPHGNPPVADGGYTEVTIGGTIAGYAIYDDEGVYTVIEVSEDSDGWTVVGWTASAC